MCPIDRKITKFLVQGRERTRNKIPIFKLNDKGMEAFIIIDMTSLTANLLFSQKNKTIPFIRLSLQCNFHLKFNKKSRCILFCSKDNLACTC